MSSPPIPSQPTGHKTHGVRRQNHVRAINKSCTCRSGSSLILHLFLFCTDLCVITTHSFPTDPSGDVQRTQAEPCPGDKQKSVVFIMKALRFCIYSLLAPIYVSSSTFPSHPTRHETHCVRRQNHVRATNKSWRCRSGSSLSLHLFLSWTELCAITALPFPPSPS